MCKRFFFFHFVKVDVAGLRFLTESCLVCSPEVNILWEIPPFFRLRFNARKRIHTYTHVTWKRCSPKLHQARPDSKIGTGTFNALIAEPKWQQIAFQCAFAECRIERIRKKKKMKAFTHTFEDHFSSSGENCNFSRADVTCISIWVKLENTVWASSELLTHLTTMPSMVGLEFKS